MKAVAVPLRSDLSAALFWSLAAAAATLAVLPYLFTLFPVLSTKAKLPFAALAAAQTLQAAVLVFLLAFLGLRCRVLTGLDSPIVRAWLGQGVFPADFPGRFAAAVMVGFVIGVAMFFLTALSPVSCPRPTPRCPESRSGNVSSHPFTEV